MKTCYRFFWSLTGAQAGWLNRMAPMAVLMRSWPAGIFAALSFVLLIWYQVALARLNRQAREREW